jgi:hypothetical protein
MSPSLHALGRTGLAALSLASVIVGCSGKQAPSPAAAQGTLRVATGPLDDTVSVQLGQSAFTRDQSVQLTYVRLVSESRCPANAICVWQGDAAVQLRAEAVGAAVDTTIHTALEPKTLTVGGNSVSLLEVQPYPGSGAQPGYVVVRVVR